MKINKKVVIITIIVFFLLIAVAVIYFMASSGRTCKSNNDCRFGEVCEMGRPVQISEIGQCMPIFLSCRYTKCPVCLSGNTFIVTPNGDVNIKDLRKGMEVWTLNSFGYKQVAKILKTASTIVPKHHKVIHLVLSDGRELFASPNHPTSDGRTIGGISVGDLIDGAYVIKSESILYDEASTYDILPSGGTGLYWANGILLKSTLS